MGHRIPLLQVPWPSYREDALQREQIVLVVQVNGKVRGKIEVPAAASEEEIQSVALEDEKVKRFLAGKAPRRIVHVPQRLVNIVV
jgi:leucyl-tRNA synthetase